MSQFLGRWTKGPKILLCDFAEACDDITNWQKMKPCFFAILHCRLHNGNSTQQLNQLFISVDLQGIISSHRKTCTKRTQFVLLRCHLFLQLLDTLGYNFFQPSSKQTILIDSLTIVMISVSRKKDEYTEPCHVRNFYKLPNSTCWFVL